MSTYVSSAGSLSDPFVEPEPSSDGSNESAGGHAFYIGKHFSMDSVGRNGKTDGRQGRLVSARWIRIGWVISNVIHPNVATTRYQRNLIVFRPPVVLYLTESRLGPVKPVETLVISDTHSPRGMQNGRRGCAIPELEDPLLGVPDRRRADLQGRHTEVPIRSYGRAFFIRLVHRTGKIFDSGNADIVKK